MIASQSAELENIIRKLKNGEGIHQNLDGGSVIHIDRPLPFICIYRYPEGVKKCVHTRLIEAQPSFVLMQQEDAPLVRDLLNTLSEILRRQFGAVMLLEVWAASDVEIARSERASHLFHLYCHEECTPSTAAFQKELAQMPVIKQFPAGGIKVHNESFPGNRDILISTETAGKKGVQYIGIEVEQFYYEEDDDSLYPMLFRAFRKQFTTALKKVFYDFIRLQTRHNVSHFHVLGRQKEGDLVWKIDNELAKINNSFDFLLLVTMTNHEEEWEKFRRGGYNHTPTFQYRIINVDPELVKRKLYNIRIEKVEDPTLAFLFRDKREELDRMLNMLTERDSMHFKYSSIQVFGSVDDELNNIASRLLEKYPPEPEDEEKDKGRDIISAEEFAEMSRREIEYLKEQYPQLDATVQLRNDIEGLMVSKGQMLIDHHFYTERSRAEALIQHEVGTHVLTYYNGKAQPLKQLYLGTPGYEDLQEGLAVLAEYLVGGLSIGRLRVLAARVVATHNMINGADFIETFREMNRYYGFPAEAAFSLVTRVFRGGGFTKDAVYLKGLIDLLKYLGSGKNLEPLLIGKIRQAYIPYIDELKKREILRPAPLRPRYLSRKDSVEKLKKLKQGATVFDLID